MLNQQNLTNQTPISDVSDASRMHYLISAMLTRVRTAQPVKVLSVSNDGGVATVGTVSIQPLVSQMDAEGNTTPHGTIYNVPYLRLQGGSNAVILDPKVGDTGIAVFCDRDISRVKVAANNALPGTAMAAGPGSARKHDMSDAIYLGTIIGSAPTTYVQVNDSGITHAAPLVNVTKNLVVGNGATGSFTAASGQIITVKDGIIINIS